MERLKQVVQIDILLGAWLIIAPYVLGYSTSRVELTNDIALGIVLVCCSWWILAAATSQAGASTLALLGGLWLIAAPFVLHYERFSRALHNDVIVGVLSTLVGATATWMIASITRRAA
jgi:hypothetical protein